LFRLCHVGKVVEHPTLKLKIEGSNLVIATGRVNKAKEVTSKCFCHRIFKVFVLSLIVLTTKNIKLFPAISLYKRRQF
jgi:hypothetical protein